MQKKKTKSIKMPHKDLVAGSSTVVKHKIITTFFIPKLKQDRMAVREFVPNETLDPSLANAKAPIWCVRKTCVPEA